MLGVGQWRHGAVCISRQHRLCRRWPSRISCIIHERLFCFNSASVKQCLPSVNHELFSMQMTQNCKHSKYCKSSPRKIFNWNSSRERRRKSISERIEEDNCEAERTSLSTAKATSSTQRPQTCTEAATKYYNYIVNETDEEREHRLPTLPKATRLDQATLKVYSQNYLLRCSDRQQELWTSTISFQRTRDSRSAFTPWATMGFTVSFILQWTG